jgi:hypothetical protein
VALVKIKVRHLNQHAGTVEVEYNGKTHSGRWNNSEEVYDVSGDVYILKAAMRAWAGNDTFELEDTELARQSGGWWAVPG